MKKLGINAQIAISMLIAAVLVTFVIGEYQRRAETKRMNADLFSQADLTVSLISGLLTESIIIQDSPVLQSGIEEALQRNPKLLSVSIKDMTGAILAKSQGDAEISPTSARRFSRYVVVEGVRFGYMEVYWSTTEGQARIAQDVRRAQIATATTVIVLSILFILQTNLLAMRPLKHTHERMSAVVAGEKPTNRALASYASKELASLDRSVSVLQETFAERDEREQALTVAKNKADTANRAKSDFLTNMSHEIRTPMNGVLAMNELLLETHLTTDQKIYAETVEKSGKALLTIIEDILNFTSIDSGDFKLDNAPFNILNALEDVVTLFSATATDNSVEMVLRYDPMLPTMFQGDVARIRQVFNNILKNAVKFTSEGCICINVTGQKVSGAYDLNIAVSDTGIGIEPKMITQIFDIFQQEDSAKNKKYQGLGMGLANSSKLIAAMGGHIDVTSDLGSGSTFTIQVTLPVAKGIEQAGDEADAFGANMRCLVVDDLKLNRILISELLTFWGMAVVSVANEAEAVRILSDKNNSFDLIILGDQIPHENGESLTNKIRAISGYQNTPLIVCPPVAQPLQAYLETGNGPCELLMKPIRKSDLMRSIRKVVRVPGPIADASVPLDSQNDHNKPINILVAEDNKTNQLIVKSMLKNLEASLTFAENGEIAVQRFKCQRPDVILMDMSMPKMDGVEATLAIRKFEQDHESQRCPIVGLTANALQDDRDRCLHAGMDDFLTKPINKKTLIGAIEQWNKSSLL